MLELALTVAYSALKLMHTFGPLDLGCDKRLMEPSLDSIALILEHENDDELVHQALQAANRSYAPYTQSFTGCAIQMKTGEVFRGRYAENAAHNPSLRGFSAAVLSMIMSNKNATSESIKRVVMVEHPITSSQKDTAQTLLSVYNNNVTMEYHRAVIARL